MIDSGLAAFLILLGVVKILAAVVINVGDRKDSATFEMSDKFVALVSGVFCLFLVWYWWPPMR